MSQFQRICLVHYHEIGLKGHNRSTFEMRLLKNLEAHLSAFPIVTIHRISGRLCVFLKEETTWEVAQEVTNIIKDIPGVARVSCGYKCERNLDLMYQAAIDAMLDASCIPGTPEDGLQDGSPHTFKVQARRNHTDFATDSMEMNRLIGAALVDAFPLMGVRMKDPDITVGVEVVQNATYIYALSIPGIGGLPVGTAGKVMCLMSSGIDSPVACWRLARRGAVCIGVHFSGRPETLDTSEYLVDDIAHILEKTGCFARLYVVPFGSYQRKMAEIVPPSLRIIMYRRYMYQIAEKLAFREGCGALVTGESLGQVASQTLENIRATDQAVSLPVFRPLIGSDKLEIIAQSQQLGTFETSSIDAPDCCTLFMPRSPETHARLDDVLAAEALLPLDDWTQEILNSVEVHDYICPSYKRKKLRPQHKRSLNPEESVD